MAAATARSAGFAIVIFASEDKLGLINELGEHIAHGDKKGDNYQYFLN